MTVIVMDQFIHFIKKRQVLNLTIKIMRTSLIINYLEFRMN